MIKKMKTVRLTESDLVRIVKRVIAEQDVNVDTSLKGKKVKLTFKDGSTSDEFINYAKKTRPDNPNNWMVFFSESGKESNTFRTFSCIAHRNGNYVMVAESPIRISKESSEMMYNALCA
jgi:hypothetical protein